MSELSKKYNIPPEAISKMIKDGVISCSWPGYEQVYELYKQGKTLTEIADTTHMTDRNVRYIIKKFQ